MRIPLVAADLALRAACIVDAVARDWRVALSPAALSRAGAWAATGESLRPPPLPVPPLSWRDRATQALRLG